MKTPLSITSTDWHLTRNNRDQIKDLIRQKIQLAKKLKINKVFCTGDIFQARKAQEEIVLNTFGEILDMFKEADIQLICIPGNHDKVSQSGTESYLTPFKNHPALFLIEIMGGVSIGNIIFSCLPYFDDETYKQKLAELIEYRFANKKEYPALQKEYDFLLTHQAFNGAINNDDSKVENDLKPTLLSQFDKVLVGHYHNKDDQGKIVYIGSICQNNFGEDDQKGFTIIYDNGEIEFYKAKFREFRKITLDVDKLSLQQLKTEIGKISDVNQANYRLELTGDNKKLDSIDVDVYKSLGFDVKLKSKESQVNIESAIQGQRIEFNNDSIVEEFNKFCEQEKIENVEAGMNYLNKIL